jgi:OmpA-OmpF porin, OOP family
MRVVLKAVCLLCLLSLALLAHVDAQQQAKPLSDVKGSKDPATVKRYEGAAIIGYKFSKFDEFTFPAGPLVRSKASTGPNLVPSKTQKVEGQYTRLVYVGPEGRSPLEIVRNYEQQLTKAGFAVVYQCARAECGGSEDDMTDRLLYTMENRLANYPPAHSGKPPGQVTETAFGNAKDGRLLVAKRAGGGSSGSSGGSGGESWISVYAATNGFTLFPETFGHPVILVDLVESAAMETNMVTVDASAMAKGIASEGHVALYGILFDTDKTDIKPESATAIAEIAKFLKQDAGVKLYVVGHTDNVGIYDYNIGLSQRRAAAVVAELTAKHGISAARLKPAGSGPLAPVAPNDTEEGRAKNRRVELVKQ